MIVRKSNMSVSSFAALVLAILMLAGCASELPDFENSPFPDSTPNVVTDTPGLRSGDSISITYFARKKASRSPYVLHRGDVLSFNLVGEPDAFANSILVQEDGNASFPIIGEVRIVGMSMTQLREKLMEKFEEKLYSNPILNLTIAETFNASENDLNSLSNNSGSNSFAVTVPVNGRISLAHLGEFNALTTPANLERQVNSRLSSQFGGRYGATVNLVSREEDALFVTGAVNSPGRIEFTGPMVPLSAIASAGGFADTAAPRKVAIIRYGKDGKPQSWIINMKQIMVSGGRAATPILLRDGDIIYVPRSNVALTNAFVQQYVLNNLPFGFGVGYSLN